MKLFNRRIALGESRVFYLINNIIHCISQLSRIGTDKYVKKPKK